MIAEGGKPIFGASIGILMLEARFPRIPGDMGNAITWPFPVHYRVVKQASPERVVLNRAEGLLDAFICAARELVDDGVDGITTNCGFLSLYQKELNAAVSVPFASSSLMQIPLVTATLPPGKQVGILTISSATLTSDHLSAIGLANDIPIGGVDPEGEFASTILRNELYLDVKKARAENIAAAECVIKEHPEIGALVLECTNMIPYANDIARTIKLPVYSMYNFVTWFQASLSPPRFH